MRSRAVSCSHRHASPTVRRASDRRLELTVAALCLARRPPSRTQARKAPRLITAAGEPTLLKKTTSAETGKNHISLFIRAIAYSSKKTDLLFKIIDILI